MGALVDCGTQQQNTPITASTQGTLACIESSDNSLQSGTYSATVTPSATSGIVDLAFRLGAGNTTSGGAVNIRGYYLQIDPINKSYQINVVNADGQGSPLPGAGTISQTLPATFTVSVTFQNNQFIPTINNSQYGAITDPASSFASGWIGLCTTTTATFQGVSLYKVS